MFTEKEINKLGQQLASTPNEFTKRVIMLEFLYDHGIQPSHFKTKSEIQELKKHRKDLYCKLYSKFPLIFEVKNA